MMCPKIPSSTAQPSLTPPVEPGSVITKVLSVTPAIHRDSAAVGTFSKPLFQKATAIPGISARRWSLTASTVRSSGVIPVPPEVNKTSGTSLPDSALSTADWISASATTSGSGVSNPWLRKNSTAMGPERSSYSPVAARVDATITIPVRDIGCYLSVAGLETIDLYNAAGSQGSTCRDADEMRCFYGLSDQMRTSSAEDMRHRCAI